MLSDAPSASRPAEKILLTDLVLRRFAWEDVPALLTTVAASYEHLHPWMPWAAEPPTLESQHEYLDETTRKWESGETFAYGIFDRSERNLLGSVALLDRIGDDGMEIGYWLHVGHAGRGIMTTCVAAFTQIVLSLDGRRRVEIHCDVANTASAAVPQRLGYRLDRIQDDKVLTPGEEGRLMIWIMTADDFPGSEAERRAHAADPGTRSPSGHEGASPSSGT